MMCSSIARSSARSPAWKTLRSPAWSWGQTAGMMQKTMGTTTGSRWSPTWVRVLSVGGSRVRVSSIGEFWVRVLSIGGSRVRALSIQRRFLPPDGREPNPLFPDGQSTNPLCPMQCNLGTGSIRITSSMQSGDGVEPAIWGRGRFGLRAYFRAFIDVFARAGAYRARAIGSAVAAEETALHVRIDPVPRLGQSSPRKRRRSMYETTPSPNCRRPGCGPA